MDLTFGNRLVNVLKFCNFVETRLFAVFIVIVTVNDINYA